MHDFLKTHFQSVAEGTVLLKGLSNKPMIDGVCYVETATDILDTYLGTVEPLAAVLLDKEIILGMESPSAISKNAAYVHCVTNKRLAINQLRELKDDVVILGRNRKQFTDGKVGYRFFWYDINQRENIVGQFRTKVDQADVMKLFQDYLNSIPTVAMKLPIQIFDGTITF